MADWATISALATAGGTLILAVATFASVRSANRAARTAERSLMVGLRPVLMPSRLEDPPQKVMFVDQRWLVAPAGGAAAEVGDGAVYMAMSVRNAGSGIAVLQAWRHYPDMVRGDVMHGDPDTYHLLTRDIYVAPNDVGFWQGALRDPASDEFAAARGAIESRQVMSLELLYTDHEGGQRTISRFMLVPRDDGRWLASVSKHWNLDTPGPR